MNINNRQQRINGELKLELIKYYEDLQFQIDIDAQEAFAKMLNDDDEQKRSKLLGINEMMVQLVRDTFESNMRRLNEYNTEDVYFLIDDEVILKECLRDELFENVCIYFKYDKLNQSFTDATLPLGVMLITDWHLDKNQLDYLSSMIEAATPFDHHNTFLYFNSVNFLNFKSFQTKVIWSFLNKIKDVLNLFYGIKWYRESVTSRNPWESFIIKLEQKKIQELLKKLLTLELHFDFSYFVEIQSWSFQHCKNLKSLSFGHDVDFNKSISFNDKSLNGLNKLESLTLMGENYIIEANLLSELVNLKELKIKQCECDHHVLDWLDNTLELLSFSVSNQNFKKVIHTLQSFTKLKSLEFVCDDLVELQGDTFHRLERLEELAIVANRLERVEDNVFNCLIHLRKLSIESYKLKIITRNILRGLSNLEVLLVVMSNLDGGDFLIEENAFENLRNLKELNIFISKLAVLRQNLLSNLTKLEKLDIYSLNIREIELEAFKSLKNLKVLRINILRNRLLSDQLEYLSTLTDIEFKMYFNMRIDQEIKIITNR